MEVIQASGVASRIAFELETKIPQDLLLGKKYIAEIAKDGGTEADYFKKELYSEIVSRFLSACEQDVACGRPVPPDNIRMAAVLHYYRTYFESVDSDRSSQQTKALEWITRAMARDPLDPDLQIKLADVFEMQGRYDEAVAIMERLERDEDSPQYVQQWLGYFLLFIDGRESDAINHSLSFHKRFPNESGGIFNASCGYAQLYTAELRERSLTTIPDSTNRSESLKLLAQSIRIDAENATLARKHSEPGDSFESFVNDDEFLRITISGTTD
jgi:tetratricopeptide (TPR) repeat protein